MLRICSIGWILCTLPPALAQGQVNFNNYVPAAGVDAPVRYPDADHANRLCYYRPVGELPFVVTAQLSFRGGGPPGSSSTESFSTVGEPTTFRQSPVGAQPYFNGITVVVPGLDAGQEATFIITVFADDFYGQGRQELGRSMPFTITLGGGVSVPADLVTLEPFNVIVALGGICGLNYTVVPEPSAAAVFGTASLLLTACRTLISRRNRYGVGNTPPDLPPNLPP